MFRTGEAGPDTPSPLTPLLFPSDGPACTCPACLDGALAPGKVFGMAIATILQCFIADEEMFKGEDRYGEGDLAELLDKASKDHVARGKGAKVVSLEVAGGTVDVAEGNVDVVGGNVDIAGGSVGIAGGNVDIAGGKVHVAGGNVDVKDLP